MGRPYSLLLLAIALLAFSEAQKTYIEVKNMNIYEHNIGRVEFVSVEQMKTVCEATPGCVGFTTDGNLHSTARNMRPTDGITFYYWTDLTEPPAAKLPIHIWPMPKSLKSGETKIYIDRPNFKFSAPQSNADLQDAIDRYSSLIFHFAGSPPSRHEGSIRSCVIYVSDLSALLQMGYDESYVLTVPEKGFINITATTVYGAYHALETLSQMIVYTSYESEYFIENGPYVIQDAPRYQHRSMLIDTARHYFPVPFLHKIIDSLSYAKYNIFHWHLSDDDSFPVEIKAYPKAWEKGAYSRYETYSQIEIQEVVEYARKRGIRVIPEIDTPGHASAMCDPELCPSAKCLHPLDPTKEATFQFLETVFSELTGSANRSGLFPDDYFHLGGDEVQYYCWEHTDHIAAWMKERNYTSHDVYHYMIERVTQFALKQQRVPVVWEDVFNTLGSVLDKRTIVHIWLRKELLLKSLKAGYRTVLSIEDPWYLDYINYKWQDMYNLEPTKDIPADLHHLIMGGGPCMWSEWVDGSVWFNTVWPKAAAPAEVLWSPMEARDVNKAFPRLQWFKCHLVRRGIGAAAVVNDRAREAPPHQDSCYLQ